MKKVAECHFFHIFSLLLGGTQMSKCIIIGPMYIGEEREFLTPDKGDLLICADGGLEKALQYGFNPDLVIGDFDSMPLPDSCPCPVRVLPVKKDETDTAACIKEGRARGYREFRIAGGMGGRFDHTIANLQCIADCASRGEQGWLVDAQNRVTVLHPGTYIFPGLEKGKFSLFAFTERVKNIDLNGTEWELKQAELVQNVPIGCSNWYKSEQITLKFTEGLLILVQSIE